MAKLSRRSIALHVANQLLTAHHKQVIMQLAAYLVETHRTKELALVVRDIEFYLAEAGSVSGTVTSAFDLTAQTKQAIETYIKQHTNAKNVELNHVVDPTVIGGVKINVPGHELDATVRRSLTILKTRYRKQTQ